MSNMPKLTAKLTTQRLAYKSRNMAPPSLRPTVPTKMSLQAARFKYSWPSEKNLLKAPINRYTAPLQLLKRLPEPLQKQYIKPGSRNVLFIVCSGNKDKIDVGRVAATHSLWVKMANLYHVKFDHAQSGVNEQPYKGKGMLGAVNRAMDGSKALSTGKLQSATLYKQGVAGYTEAGTLEDFAAGFGRIVIFSIESYFDLPDDSLSCKLHGGADYGALLLFDPFFGMHVNTISEGVRVPWFFIKAALYNGGSIEKGGDVTVGSEMESRIEGFDGKAWQHIIAGQGNTRKEILLRAAKTLPAL